MRQIQLLVSDDQLEDVRAVLEEEEIDFVRQRAWVDDEQEWLVEVPVPTDAIGYVLDRLGEAGVEENQYAVIASLESAMTPRAEALQERFASDFDPLSRTELRSKARDMSQDPTSFFAMIFASAIIATAGLLVESPAVVVGSMVIAPIVGPVLTAAVGATTGDREMLRASVWIQAAGLLVAVAGAGAFGFALQVGGFVPSSLDITSIDLIALRLAPNVETLAIGLAAGAAGAFGLATKGPTSLIGVMIAAALIPAAATVGIAAAWGEYRIAVGSSVLLLLSMILINVGAYAVLRRFEYRPESSGWLLPPRRSARWAAIVGTALVVVVLVALVGVASVQQIGFERTINEEVRSTLESPEYGGVDPVSVRIQYRGPGPFGSPETVTVTASRTADGEPPQVAGDLEERIQAATDREVIVRVRFVEYQRADDSAPSAAPANARLAAGPAGRW